MFCPPPPRITAFSLVQQGRGICMKGKGGEGSRRAHSPTKSGGSVVCGEKGRGGKSKRLLCSRPRVLGQRNVRLVAARGREKRGWTHRNLVARSRFQRVYLSTERGKWEPCRKGYTSWRVAQKEGV